MQRRVGQHDAERGHCGCDARSDFSAAAFFQQDDGLLVIVEVRFLCVAEAALAPHGVEAAQHDGEGLLRAAFALAQPLHGRLISCVTSEVKAADALDGDNAARLQHMPCACDCSMVALFTAKEIDVRSAVVAAYGLRVVAARLGMGVFVTARRAHGERSHARTLAVVGHGVEDREPGTARGAVDERMEVAAVAFIEKFGLTLGTDGDVG